ncbi:MAG: hypothetical protein V4598_00635 [Bdellovibrionota bacterium]
MKFGMESEKHIFNLETKKPSEGVFSFIEALTEFRGNRYHTLGDNKTTNEFVLNMIEFGTTPSESPMEVLKDYLLHYLMVRKVAKREKVALVPLASLPLDFLPHMVSKWGYYVQNSILSGRKQDGWMMKPDSPLRAAGNCAGIHVHVEIETAPEFLYSNRELMDKFNMGLQLTPMIAFSSSPYFFGKHSAMSMRGHSYYNETYKHFAINGALPSVMSSSMAVLDGVRKSIDHWMLRGTEIGFNRDQLEGLMRGKGANWNPVRWNRTWNTIELRCLDSDSIELDASKFLWITSCMKRMDLKGEALQCRPLNTERRVDRGMLREAFQLSGREVAILPTHAISEIFERAIEFGTRDDLVEEYLHALAEFSVAGLQPEEKRIFTLLYRTLETHRTTSEWMLNRTGRKAAISNEEAAALVIESISRQDQVIQNFRSEAPEIFSLLDEMVPQM